jgi:tripeptidyl-peptidase-2
VLGVDPAAQGLAQTSEGNHKIIDLIDCSGCGDVDMSTVVTSTTSYTDLVSGKSFKDTIVGLSGQRLFLPTQSSKWSNPSGVWRIGLKDAKDILPKHSLKRCEEEERKIFEKKNLDLISLAASSSSTPSDPSSNVKEEELVYDKVLSAQVLKDMYKNSYKPLGANVMDCVVWNDGENWRAVVDTDGKGGTITYSANAF